MRFGKPKIRRCEHCAGLIEQFTVMSGNTFGARLWTDGKFDAPMLPKQPKAAKCPHCEQLIWLREQELVSDLGIKLAKLRGKNIQPYRDLTTQDYFKLLNQTTIDADTEIYLRTQVWWAENDKRRDTEVLGTLSQRERENVNMLAELLDKDDPHERIMLAEIKRELGQFKDCERLLLTPFEGNLDRVAWRISSLADQKDPFVREIDLEEGE